MSFISVICGAVQILILLSITGVLASFAALSRLMEVIFTIVQPTVLFMLRQSVKLILMEILLSDLGDKLPWLCPVLRPEYTPYLSTAGTVLLGWMVVCWISHIVWTLLGPLAVSAIAVVLVCPTTAKWVIRQMGPNVENALRSFLSKVQASMPDVR